MSRLTLADLEELERLEAAVEPGEWYCTGPLNEEESLCRGGIPVGIGREYVGDDGTGLVDLLEDIKESEAELIATSRNRLKDLIALARVGLLADAMRDAEQRVEHHGKVEIGEDLSTVHRYMECVEAFEKARAALSQEKRA